MSLNAGRGRKWIKTLFFEKLSALVIECVVIAIDVPQIAGSADNVFPCRAFRFQQPGDVVVSAAKLRAEINGIAYYLYDVLLALSNFAHVPCPARYCAFTVAAQ
jgi:hypothetical protein